jgi:hypothetical protein
MRIGNIRVMIYSDDHRPAHVHVVDGAKKAIFMLDMVELSSNFGFTKSEIRRISDVLGEN